MPDDILDAAQKTINDAAGKLPADPVPEPPVPETETVEPKKEEVAPPAPEVPPEEPKKEDVIPPPEAPPEPPKESEEPNNPESLIVPPPESARPKNPPKMPGKRKRVSGVILGIVALLLLALPVGVYFISQKNQQLADVRSLADNNAPPEPYPTGNTCNDYVSEPGPPCGPCGYRLECKVCGPNNTGCKWYFIRCEQTNNCNNNPTATPTPPPAAGECSNLRILDTSGNQLTPADLHAGQNVILAVKGSGNPTKARFRVNGDFIVGSTNDNGWTDSTTKNSNGEYVAPFTVYDNVTDFQIDAEVQVNGNWK